MSPMPQAQKKKIPNGAEHWWTTGEKGTNESPTFNCSQRNFERLTEKFRNNNHIYRWENSKKNQHILTQEKSKERQCDNTTVLSCKQHQVITMNSDLTLVKLAGKQEGW